ncbi:threonine/serine exporter family protein [Clostridium sp. BJN0001]|uniref:threonine/serine exporter family protein n=1 Tax=Clostridium sp. BJN0001 TaxID=2930219 RepID=UPI001FD538CD|nr:threonine/serine exporter family protein [Clostridium sp. BJN0001]
MNLNKLLKISTLAGKILIENGAETYRVEETVVRICLSFGASSCETFATPTGIIATVTYNEEVSSLVRRIKKRTVDLNKIDSINDLSRKCQQNTYSLDQFYRNLLKIENEKRYSKNLTNFLSGISAGSYAVMFGGNFQDFFAAFIIGYLINILASFFSKFQVNEFFINSLCAGFCAFIAVILTTFGLNGHYDKIIMGSIMLLVPGLAITNAIRDTIAGDLLAGITKAIEAVLVAMSIAVGTGAVLSILLNLDQLIIVK